jgi:hypothetical protein
MRLTAEQQGQMVLDILHNDFHRPFVKGKANRRNIEEQIIMGLYRKEIPPLSQADVDCIIEMVDQLIADAHI